MDADRRRAALREIAAGDPELAARLILMTLPATASRIHGDLVYDLEVEGIGVRRVSVADGASPRGRVPPPATESRSPMGEPAWTSPPPRDCVSYGYPSRQIYGLAYRTLRRRMSVLGVEIPPPEEFMPGPIDEPSEAAPTPVAAQSGFASR